MQQDWFANLKILSQNSDAEDLGLQTMDGKEVKGFRVKDENIRCIPVTILFGSRIPESGEISSKGGNPASQRFRITLRPKNGIKSRKGENTMEMVLSNFQFDVPLDESLFSLTPPEGYKLQEMNMDFSNAGEKDVIEVLRRYADMENGAFPDSLTDQILMMKLTIKSTMKWSFEMGNKLH